MNNANEVTPFGSVKYDNTGTQYTKDALGNQIAVPTFTKTTTLSAPEQAKYDMENQVAGKAGGIANAQLGRLDAALSTPIQNPMAGKNYDTYRDQALQAMRQRMQPEMDRQYESNLTRLANQGVRPGSEAYREAVALADRGRNDAELAMFLGSGDEMGRALSFDQSALQADMAVRNQPINEISALMGQTQVNMPQFQQYQGGRIAPTSVAGNIYQSAAIDQQKYQQKMASHNAMMGGLFSLGSSAMRLPLMM